MGNKFQQWKNKGQFSFIIPCHKLFKRYDGRYEVDACIDSILDQDYTNYELIVCANGPDRDKIVKHLKKRYKKEEITYVVTEPANAAIARNAGAIHANGEFRSYFSCDLQLLPGALTQWKKGFDKYKDISILYFNIHYVKDDEVQLTSNQPPYNRYHHECENIIDGAMPVRAKYDYPWHKDVEALQDWYWSLGVTKNAPAKLVPGVYYLTEVPKPGGLTDTFINNWIPLNKKVRRFHGIPERDTVVTSIGAPAHAINVAQVIGADYKGFQTVTDPQKSYDYDFVYLIGMFPQALDVTSHVLNNAGKKDSARIVHWIGTDVQQMMDVSWKTNKQIAENLPKIVDKQLSVSDLLTKELEEMGLDAETLTLYPREIPKYIGDRKTKKKRIAIYTAGLGEYNLKKYGLELISTVAKMLPNIEFSVFGVDHNGPVEFPSDNMTLEGRVDMESFGKKIDLYVRVIEHDGMPQTAIEFLLMGKEVLCYPAVIQGAHLAPKYDLSTGENGLSAAKDLAKRIMYILEHPISDSQRKKTRKFWVDKIKQSDYVDRFESAKKEARQIADLKEKEYRKNHPEEFESSSEGESL